MTPGLAPNIRLVPDNDPPALSPDDIHVEVSEGDDTPEIDPRSGKILEIKHPDGSITVSMDGRPLVDDGAPAKDRDWFDNLADEIDDGELSRIAENLLRGIKDDIDSRREWIEDRAQGIKLLGLRIEVPGVGSSVDGAPVEGMSKVRHPLLLEACLRFQANARSELLPTDGPVKVRDDRTGSTTGQNALAEALESDLNHYLTSVANEYYPDTDRMLLMLGFGGSAFKKIYFCPLRGRPVSESVDADDLIVNNSATDLRSAKRVTHRVNMTTSTVKRLQILGVYRDIELGTPVEPERDAAQREEAATQGVSPGSMHPDDRDREIYECYCELDIPGFEHKWKNKETGLEIPYRVTIDVSTKKILSIVRNYDKNDQELPTARTTFVKYTFVPGIGFYDIGLLHILGNTTNAVTAAWRELLDAGMYANFPGFLMADSGARQNTNIFRVPPGGAAVVKTNGMKIGEAVMALPYKEPSQALMALVGNMAETGMRIGGTSEAQVGEGRADAPVGTTLAMIEQATKVLNAVHKRLHAAQAEEFQLLVDCFREHPDSFWKRCKKKTVNWNDQMFLQALDDCELVPCADPNTASHTQRIMKVMGLKQLQAANPAMFDPIAVDTEALKALGWSNPEQFLAKTDPSQPPPEMLKEMKELEIKDKDANAKMLSAQTKASEAETRAVEGQQKNQIEAAKVQGEMALGEREILHKTSERRFAERKQLIDAAQNLAVHPESAPIVAPLLQPSIEAMHNDQNGEG